MAEANAEASAGGGGVRAPTPCGSVKFFIDNNLSTFLAKGMRGFGEDVIHLLDQYPQPERAPADAEWLEFAAKEGRFVITHDKRIRWRHAEQEAVRKFKIGAFFIVCGELNRCEQIQLLVKAWPTMKQKAQQTQPPFIWSIRRGGGPNSFERKL